MLIRGRIESSVFEALSGQSENESLTCLKRVGEHLIAKSIYEKSDIGLLIYTGIYRSRFLVEPSMAALTAKELGLSSSSKKGFLAFDILNGAIGFVNAIQTADAYLQSEPTKVAMIISCEIDNHKESDRESRVDMTESASAVILDAKPTTIALQLRYLFSQPAVLSKKVHLELEEESYLEIEISKDAEKLQIALLDKALDSLKIKELNTKDSCTFYIDPKISKAKFESYSKLTGIADKLHFSEKTQDFVGNNFVFLWNQAQNRKAIESGFVVLGSGGQAVTISPILKS